MPLIPVSTSSAEQFLLQVGLSFPATAAYPILDFPVATFYTLSSASCLWHYKHTYITVTKVTDVDGSCDAGGKPYKKLWSDYPPNVKNNFTF